MEREGYCGFDEDFHFPDELELANNIEYRSSAFLRCYLEQCNYVRMTQPARALTLSERCLLVTQEVCAGSAVAAYASAVVGSCLRALGRLAEATPHFRSASDRLDALEPIDQADILFHVALFRRQQKRYADALAAIDRAITTYRLHGSEPRLHRFGMAHMARCTIHSFAGDDAQALHDVGIALKYIDPKRSPLDYAGAIHNLAALLQRSTRPDGVMRAAEHTRQAFRVGRFGRRSVPRAKLYWVQGQIDRRLGVSRRAERMFRRARELMVAHQLPLEVAVVSLDLASLLLEEGRYAEIPAIAGEAVELFRDQVADPEALEALRVWRRAADASALSEAINSQVRAKLWAATCAPTTDTTARLLVPLAGAR